MDATSEAGTTTETKNTEATTVESRETNANAGEIQRTDEETVDYISASVKKLTDELIHFTGGQLETIVHKEVAETLMKFCKQSAAFAEVVAKTPRTLSDCCVKIVEGAERTGISDIKAYRRAVQFYFPNSDVMFHMQIRHTGAAPSEEEINRPAEKPKPPVGITPKTSNNQKGVSAVSTDTNTDTNTIHLDLFDDDDETAEGKQK